MGGGWHSGLPKNTRERIGFISYGFMVSALLPRKGVGGKVRNFCLYIFVFSDINIPYLAVQEGGSVTRPTKQRKNKFKKKKPKFTHDVPMIENLGLISAGWFIKHVAYDILQGT